jgi:2,4-dienoyl-CoA reductase-like NADH-dependent reductase (Old Yellow Enzyme family)
MLNVLAPRLGKQTKARPRVFVMGYPGTGNAGQSSDINAEQSYKAMSAHMNTVAGNEMLVLDGANRYQQAVFFGLNPGLIKTNIRDNFFGKDTLKSRIAEWLIGRLTPSADEYARRISPLLFSPDIAQYNGAMFNNKGQAILPSEGLSKEHIHQFMAASAALIGRTLKDTTMNKAFETVSVGRYTLKNRLVMAPMTRSRAQYDGTPGELAAEYYAQRAGVGLIVAEGTQPSDDGQGYLTTPGIYTDAHVAGWRKVTSAVHAKDGRIFIQLMHAGRMSHPDNTPHHRQGVAPSAIAPGAFMFTATGMQDIPMPRALSTEEVHQTVQDFRLAARRAIEAGADGVEIHGANAYLIQQFFAPSSNQRSDEYGGSIENRARFAIEIAKAIAQEIGGDRTAIRLSPGTTMWGIDEGTEGPALYRYLVTELDKLGLAYVHVMHQGDDTLLADIRNLWHGTLILNRPGRAREQIGADISTGLADLEAYGQMILANPDFVVRLQTGADMNEANRNAYFGGNEQGYTDYPALAA